MNSPVTALSETSVMSSSCFAISDSSRSNGPSKLPRETENPALSSCAESTTRLGDCATGDQLSGELAVRLRGRVVGSELGDRTAGHAGIRELHGAADHGLEHAVAERLDHAVEHLARVQRARVVHR